MREHILVWQEVIQPFVGQGCQACLSAEKQEECELFGKGTPGDEYADPKKKNIMSQGWAPETCRMEFGAQTGARGPHWDR